MSRSLHVFCIASIILCVCCQKKMSDTEFEKNIMTEIFPDLIDSICIDSRIVLNPPPIYGALTYDENGHRLSVDSTMSIEEQKQRMAKWKLNQEAIEKDTSKLIVAFNPKIERSSKDLKEYLEEHFKVTEVFYPKIEGDSTYTIDFKNIPLKGKFQLRNISEFPKDRYEFWLTKYNFVFSGVVYFSRIQFDETKKFGVLDSGFTCGRHCGNGFRIYIKNIKNKWVIDEIENTWIS